MTLTGGPMFWILIVMAVVAVVVFFERFVELRRAQIDWQDFLKGVINVLNAGNVDEALSICEETPAPVAAIMAAGIRQRKASARAIREVVDAQGRAEIGRLDRRLAALSIIGHIAPLLGLLGTIIGFIKAIRQLHVDELVTRADLITLSSEAFVSAALGLAVAIPVIVMYASLRIRLDRLVVNLEAAATEVMSYLTAKGERAA